MSTIKTTNITHGSNSGTANMVLASDGDITFAKKPALGRQILEQFYTPCDGSVIATSAGNLTVPTVTGVQTLTTTHADITGSSIAYTPPSGTTQVIYRFSFHWSRAGDDSTRGHFKLLIDSDEVTNARLNSGGGANYGGEGQVHFEWGINIGGSAVTATGRQASWSSSKTLKIQGREYEGTVEQKLHETYYWDGSASTQFSQPCVGITAIG